MGSAWYSFPIRVSMSAGAGIVLFKQPYCWDFVGVVSLSCTEDSLAAGFLVLKYIHISNTN